MATSRSEGQRASHNIVRLVRANNTELWERHGCTLPYIKLGGEFFVLDGSEPVTHEIAQRLSTGQLYQLHQVASYLDGLDRQLDIVSSCHLSRRHFQWFARFQADEQAIHSLVKRAEMRAAI